MILFIICVYQIGLLKTLRSLCVEREPEVCITVRKLAMVSTMAVFKDIVPGYVPTNFTWRSRLVYPLIEVFKAQIINSHLLCCKICYIILMKLCTVYKLLISCQLTFNPYLSSGLYYISLHLRFHY